MNLNEFEIFIKKVNSNKPFKMYMHGCRDSSIGTKFVKEKEDFKIEYARNNIYSTFVNCGTPNTDFIKRMKEYTYGDGVANIIMIMPSDIKIDNYCGCLKGQARTTKGYTNPVEIDYLTIACNNTLNSKSQSRYDFKYIDNRLILGYMDNETNQFVINPECILFADNPEDYDEFIKNATKSANEIYNQEILTHIAGKIMFNEDGYTKQDLDKLEALIKDSELRDNFIGYAKALYENSEEKRLYDDIENCEFRNSVSYGSIFDSAINDYLKPTLSNDNIDELLNSLDDDLDANSQNESLDNSQNSNELPDINDLILPDDLLLDDESVNTGDDNTDDDFTL